MALYKFFIIIIIIIIIISRSSSGIPIPDSTRKSFPRRK